ncbi:hypothetical protein L596_015477 [Steinernema carpocapsae]|uniref:Tyrosine-protein phosphatase domain-containing protein n=1 Tax=Steinernema carpocapsae TaxID=34508 RepID=A0A4U5NFZ1_STECR|nr:hypothetical protein L596_015477 [Steinernema carpocapsae]
MVSPGDSRTTCRRRVFKLVAVAVSSGDNFGDASLNTLSLTSLKLKTEILRSRFDLPRCTTPSRSPFRRIQTSDETSPHQTPSGQGHSVFTFIPGRSLGGVMAKPLPSAMAAYFAGSGGAAFRQFCNNVNTIGLGGLREQFQELKNYQPTNPAKTVFEANHPAKNRYKDVACLDISRVVLKGEDQSDYIHANWVQFEVLPYKFICAQGPLDSTVVDFWRMIWQEKVVHIFMLCRIEEQGRSKCAQYWPKAEGASMVVGGISIRNDKVHSPDKNVLASNLTISYQGESRGVDHRQWVTWPDKTIPRALDTSFKLLSLIRDRKTPVIVHCSAGIGRTGTLVVTDVLCRSLQANKVTSLKAVVEQVRNQRAQAVQTEDQYLYVHYVVLQRIAARGFVDYAIVKNFCNEYESYILQSTKVPQEPLIRLPNITPLNYQTPAAVLATYKAAIAALRSKIPSSPVAFTALSNALASTTTTAIPSESNLSKTKTKTRRNPTKRTKNATKRTRNTGALPSKGKQGSEPAIGSRASSEVVEDGKKRSKECVEGELPLIDALPPERSISKENNKFKSKVDRERLPASWANLEKNDKVEKTDKTEKTERTAEAFAKSECEDPKPHDAKDAATTSTKSSSRHIDYDYDEPFSVFCEDSMALDAAKETPMYNSRLSASESRETVDVKAAGVDPMLLDPPISSAIEGGKKNSKEYTELNRYLALQQKFASAESEMSKSREPTHK